MFKWRQVFAIMSVAAIVIATSASPGAADTIRSQASAPADVGIASIVYISGSTVNNGSCKGWMNRRTTDNYVQALGQSWGDYCLFWLERKRIGAYDWTQVSNTYWVLNSSDYTGFHWNGTDAASQVCVSNRETYALVCSGAFW